MPVPPVPPVPPDLPCGSQKRFQGRESSKTQRRGFRRATAGGLVAAGGLAASGIARAADKAYGPGVTDTEIKLGQTMPYSGPNSALGTIGRATEIGRGKV